VGNGLRRESSLARDVQMVTARSSSAIPVFR